MVRDLLWVAGAGALGSVGRWALSGYVQRFGAARFPVGTLAVNLLGSLAMGLLLGLALESEAVPRTVRVAVAGGFLGAFTTFSTFSWETVRLVEQGAWPLALANVGVSVGGGLVACWAGILLARAWLGAL